MEELYGNVDYDKGVCPVPATDHRGLNGCKRRVYLAAILSLGLLSVCMLVGLVVLGVHNNVSGEMISDLLAIHDNLTEHLQASNDKLSSLTEERNQLKANLSEITEKLNKLKHLSTQRKTCPAGWNMFSCSCYLLSTISDSWDQGREDCRSRGADLVVIDSAEEQSFLSEFTKEESWIGLSDKEREGTWKWVDESDLTLRNWEKNQPDNGNGDPRFGEEDCAHLTYSDKKIWNDMKCTAFMRWICEKTPIAYTQLKGNI